MRSLIPLIAVLFLTGCATYEYDLVDPQQFAGHIGGKQYFVVDREPLQYKLRAIDSRLVLQIYNPSDENVQLLGSASYVVDPKGQSHPLPSLSIASNSYGKLILPPLRPVVRETGPTFGIGIGTRVGQAGERRIIDRDPLADQPRYFAVYEDDNAGYWDWQGEGEIRMRLVYQRQDKTFSDDFVFKRVKM